MKNKNRQKDKNMAIHILLEIFFKSSIGDKIARLVITNRDFLDKIDSSSICIDYHLRSKYNKG